MIAGVLLAVTIITAGNAAPVYNAITPTSDRREAMREAVRDRRGVVIGTVERQSLTAKVVARDAHGILLGTYDTRSDTTRDARGVLLGRGDRLIGLLVGR